MKHITRAFPDGMNAGRSKCNDALLVEATYYLWLSEHADKADLKAFPDIAGKVSRYEAYDIAHDLALKLESLYGGYISSAGSDGKVYFTSGANGSRVYLSFLRNSLKYGFKYLELIYTNDDYTAYIEKNEDLLALKVSAERERRIEEAKTRQEEHDEQVANGNKNGL